MMTRGRRHRADEIAQAQAAIVGANIRVLRQRNRDECAEVPAMGLIINQ